MISLSKWTSFRQSADSEEESKLDAQIDIYHSGPRRPSQEELQGGILSLRPSFVSLPEPRQGHSPPIHSVRYPNYSFSYGSLPTVNTNTVSSSSAEKVTSVVALLNIISHLLGVGVLAMPWVFATTGWISIVVCLLCGAASAYTAVLLTNCQRTLNWTESYQEIADVAFGLTGRYIVSFFFVIVILLDLVCYLHLFSITVSTPTSWREMCLWSTFTFGTVNIIIYNPPLHTTAVLGAFASLVLVGMLLTDVASQVLQVSEAAILPTEWFKESIVSTFGVVAYCYSGHLAVPLLVAKMKHPQEASRVIICAFSLVTLIQIAVGSLGFIIYDPVGAYANAFVFLFLAKSGLVVWDSILRVTLAVVLICKALAAVQPLVDYSVEVCRPLVSRQFFEHEHEHEEQVSPLRQHRNNNNNQRQCLTMVMKTTVRAVLPFVVLAIALSWPFNNFVSLLNLAGCVSLSTSAIIPCLIALEILRDELGFFAKLACRILVACALVMATTTIFRYVTT